MELAAIWYSDDEWRGYVLDDRRERLLEAHVFVTWVAGIAHFPDAVDLTDFSPGREIVLRPEPDNPFDPNAIGVWNAAGTVQVGHVPAVICAGLPPWPERHGLIIGEMFEKDRAPRPVGGHCTRAGHAASREGAPPGSGQEMGPPREASPPSIRGVESSTIV